MYTELWWGNFLKNIHLEYQGGEWRITLRWIREIGRRIKQIIRKLEPTSKQNAT
jgi:hypothetical protein